MRVQNVGSNWTDWMPFEGESVWAAWLKVVRGFGGGFRVETLLGRFLFLGLFGVGAVFFS